MSPLASDTNHDVGTYEPVSTEPSLGLMTNRDPPRYTQIPPGAHISVILDPKHPDTMTRWVLVSVTAKALNLKCDCTVPGCTRTARYVAKYAGVHPQRER